MPAVNLVLITRKSKLNKARGFIETWTVKEYMPYIKTLGTPPWLYDIQKPLPVISHNANPDPSHMYVQ